MSPLLFAFLLLQVVYAIAIPKQVLDGFYPGRSASFFAFDGKPPLTSSLAVIQLSDPKASKRHSTFRQSALIELIACSSGISFNFDPDFVCSSDPFALHSAEMVLVIEGLDLTSSGIFPSSERFEINPVVYPSDTLSELASLWTGSVPRDHGIVTGRWKSHEGSINLLKRRPGVSDIFQTAFVGEPLIISVSSENALGELFLPLNRRENSYFVKVNGNSVESEGEVSLSMQSDVLKALLSDPSEKFQRLVQNIPQSSISVSGDGFAIQIGSLQALFQFDNEYERLFIIEMIYLLHFPSNLERSSLLKLTKDETPDLFAVSISGYKHLSSAQQSIALPIVESVVSNLMNEMNQMTKRRMGFYLIGAQSRNVHNEAKVINSLRTHFDTKYFPSLYPLSTEKHHCKVLKDALEGSEYLPVCLENTRNVLLEVSDEVQSNADPATFQIVLWLSVVLILTVISVICVSGTMETQQDSFLYSKLTNNAPYNS